MRTNFNMAEENITMIRGDTVAFAIEFVGEYRNIDLGHAYLTAKQNRESTTKAFQKTLGDGIEKIAIGKYSVRIDPDDTKDLDAGRYWYDLRVALMGEVFTLMWGILEIIQESTENVDSSGGDEGGGEDVPVTEITEFHNGDDIKATSSSYVACNLAYDVEPDTNIYITYSYQDGNDTRTARGSLRVESPSSELDTDFTNMTYTYGEKRFMFNSKVSGKTVKILEVSYNTSENVVKQDMDYSITQGETATVTLSQSPVTGTKIAGILDWNDGGKQTFNLTAGTAYTSLGINYDGDKTMVFSATGTNVGYDVYYVVS